MGARLLYVVSTPTESTENADIKLKEAPSVLRGFDSLTCFADIAQLVEQVIHSSGQGFDSLYRLFVDL